MNTTLYKIPASLGRQFLFWLLMFAAARTIFLLYNLNLLNIEGIPAISALASYWYAIPLDVATAGYLLLFPLLLSIIQTFYSPRWINTVNKIYTLLAIILYTLLVTAELGIYPEWKTKMPFKVFNYLSHPSEVYDTVATSIFFTLIVIWIAFAGLSFWLYKKYFYKDIVNVPQSFIASAIAVFIILPLMFAGIRGGVQPIPINQSKSYYSTHNILNLAAVNSGFNLMISAIENYKNLGHNPFDFYPEAEAEERVNQLLFTPRDSTTVVLDTNRPNIVLLILESWSADLIESLGGEPGITPEFHELEKQGILFSGLWATGPRSEQAMGSIFAGFPAHPISSVTVQPEKFVKVPTITSRLINEGYHTSFYFGGQLMYGNIKGFILQNGFAKVVEGADFKNKVIRGKLGVHDEYVLSRQLADLNKEKQPFFSALFTLSSHAPYDQPMEEVLKWGDNERPYINSAHYTDKCLGNYFREARKQPWFKNTLFIIVADHSHNSYRNWSFTTPAYHKIPLLFYGDVIKKPFRGTKISRLSNQSDLAATLLNQLNLDASEFKWSRNLLNPYAPEFAYFSFEEGLGFVVPDGHFVYDARIDHFNEVSLPENKKDEIIKTGKSYLQVIFQKYMDL
ncbi:Sulfatase [anaerobic digester metagenome]|nr:LTA synthase family protein [Lentimicrobiaceae bacterium]